MPIEKLGKMRQAFPGHGFQSGFRGFPDRGGGLCIEMTVSDDFNDKFLKKKALNQIGTNQFLASATRKSRRDGFLPVGPSSSFSLPCPSCVW